MHQPKWMYLVAVMVCMFGLANNSHAQAGRCANAQINQAYAALRMTPNGSGYTGDCNPNNYGAGSWTGLNDLEIRIQHAHDCADPWIGQVYWYTYSRPPTATECNAINYGAGHWSNYMDLAAKVKTYQAMSAAMRAVPAAVLYHLSPGGYVVDAQGRTVAGPGSYKIISQDGSGLTAAQVQNIVVHGGDLLQVSTNGQMTFRLK